MDLEAVLVLDLVLRAPPSEGLPTTVVRVPVVFGTNALSDHPVDREFGDVSLILSSEFASVQSFWIASPVGTIV